MLMPPLPVWAMPRPLAKVFWAMLLVPVDHWILAKVPGTGQEPRRGDRVGGGPVTGFARHGGGPATALHQTQRTKLRRARVTRRAGPRPSGPRSAPDRRASARAGAASRSPASRARAQPR